MPDNLKCMKTQGTNKSEAIVHKLRAHGLTPTRQRLDIAQLLLERPMHLTADEVYAAVSVNGGTSRATVYNTLSAFVDCGLVRQVNVDSARIYYDSNTAPHHHFFDTDTGQLTDIEPSDVNFSRLPDLPNGKQLDSIEVIVRVSSAK